MAKCSSCGGGKRHILQNVQNKTVIPTQIVAQGMTLRDIDFVPVYYIGEQNEYIKGKTTGISYGVRLFSAKLLLHKDDFDAKLFSYDLPSKEPALDNTDVLFKDMAVITDDDFSITEIKPKKIKQKKENVDEISEFTG